MAHRVRIGKYTYSEQEINCLNKYRLDPELNQGRAYQSAYPSCTSKNSAWANGSAIISSHKGQDYLKAMALEENADIDVKVTVERIIQELKRAAFLNPKLLFDGDDRYKSIHELPDYVARAIASIKHRRTTTIKENGKTKIEYDIVEIKLVSKEKTLELLGKHLVMFTERFQVESEAAMYERVKGEIMAAGEAELAMVMANARRQRAIRLDTTPHDDTRGPEKPVDKTSFEYLGSMI